MSKFDISDPQRSGTPALSIEVQQEDHPQEPDKKYGFSSDLNKYRNAIDNIKSDDWKRVRWYINEYDFLVKDPIINRAFYKYWEILNEFELFEDYSQSSLILHCAEAPGGFIQGTNIYLQVDRLPDYPNLGIQSTEHVEQVNEDGWMQVRSKKKKPKKTYRIFSISLNKDLPQYKSYNLPSYNKNVLNKHICITYGKDNTGDINNWENVKHIKTLAKDDFFLITADGGFDEGTDFNNKEQLHYSLILSEIYTAIQLQKRGGHFVLKMFDAFTETSVHLMYLLSLCYQNVYCYKPKTSRPTNSEKYIVCKDFDITEESRAHIIDCLTTLHTKIKHPTSKYVSFTLFTSIPERFKECVYKMNTSLIQKQCEFLEKAVDLCGNTAFLDDYDNKLSESLERRRSVFHDWQEQFNLSSYV